LGRMFRVSTGLVICLLLSLMIVPFQLSPMCEQNSEEPLLRSQIVRAQEFSSPWNWTYGTANYDRGTSVVDVSTGGFAVTGSTDGGGLNGNDVWLILTDDNGNAQSSHTYGGVLDDIGWDILEVSTGGFVLSGETESFGAGDFDAWLIRVDASGNHLWNHTFGGTYDEWGWSVIEVSTGGFAISGRTASLGAGSSDVWLIRTDADGNELWNKTYGGIYSDVGRELVEVSGGGFAIIGATQSYGSGSSDVWLIRTDADGNELWSRTFGGLTSDSANGLIEVSTGGFAIVGRTQSFGAGATDLWLIRTNANGNSLWNQTFGGLSLDEGQSLVEISTGGFAITGFTGSSGAGVEDLWLIFTDTSGTSLVNYTFGGTEFDIGNSIIEVSTDGFLIVGTTESFGAGVTDTWLIRVTAQPSPPPIPGFPVEAIVLALLLTLSLGVLVRRHRRK
jgi:predicted secreted protein